MSLDFLQNKQGLMQFNALPVAGTTGTASTIASNQFPAGYEFGAYQGSLAGSNSTGGGAPIVIPNPRTQATTDFQAFSAVSGTISHNNCAVVLLSVSTTGSSYNLEQASAHGQMLTIVNIPGTTCSIATGLTTSGFNATTTAACKVLDVAITLASTEAAFLQAYAQLGGTATNSVPFVWHRLK